MDIYEIQVPGREELYQVQLEDEPSPEEIDSIVDDIIRTENMGEIGQDRPRGWERVGAAFGQASPWDQFRHPIQAHLGTPFEAIAGLRESGLGQAIFGATEDERAIREEAGLPPAEVAPMDLFHQALEASAIVPKPLQKYVGPALLANPMERAAMAMLPEGLKGPAQGVREGLVEMEMNWPLIAGPLGALKHLGRGSKILTNLRRSMEQLKAGGEPVPPVIKGGNMMRRILSDVGPQEVINAVFAGDITLNSGEAYDQVREAYARGDWQEVTRIVTEQGSMLGLLGVSGLAHARGGRRARPEGEGLAPPPREQVIPPRPLPKNLTDEDLNTVEKAMEPGVRFTTMGLESTTKLPWEKVQAALRELVYQGRVRQASGGMFELTKQAKEPPVIPGEGWKTTEEEEAAFREFEKETADIDVGEYEAQERIAIAEADKRGRNVDFLDLPPVDPNVPFAQRTQEQRRSAEAISWLDYNDGRIKINRRVFQKWLDTIRNPERKAEAVASLMDEEHIHGVIWALIGKEGAASYWNSLTGFEKWLVYTRYGGRFGDWKTSGLEPSQLGQEALRGRLQQLSRMTPREVAETAGIERWKIQTIYFMEKLVSDVRARLGKDATLKQRELLDHISQNLNVARQVIEMRVPGEEGEPAMATFKGGEEDPFGMDEELRRKLFGGRDDAIMARQNAIKSWLAAIRANQGKPLAADAIEMIDELSARTDREIDTALKDPNLSEESKAAVAATRHFWDMAPDYRKAIIRNQIAMGLQYMDTARTALEQYGIDPGQARELRQMVHFTQRRIQQWENFLEELDQQQAFPEARMKRRSPEEEKARNEALDAIAIDLRAVADDFIENIEHGAGPPSKPSTRAEAADMLRALAIIPDERLFGHMIFSKNTIAKIMRHWAMNPEERARAVRNELADAKAKLDYLRTQMDQPGFDPDKAKDYEQSISRITSDIAGYEQLLARLEQDQAFPEALFKKRYRDPEKYKHKDKSTQYFMNLPPVGKREPAPERPSAAEAGAQPPLTPRDYEKAGRAFLVGVHPFTKEKIAGPPKFSRYLDWLRSNVTGQVTRSAALSLWSNIIHRDLPRAPGKFLMRLRRDLELEGTPAQGGLGTREIANAIPEAAAVRSKELVVEEVAGREARAAALRAKAVQYDELAKKAPTQAELLAEPPAEEKIAKGKAYPGEQIDLLQAPKRTELTREEKRLIKAKTKKTKRGAEKIPPTPRQPSREELEQRARALRAEADIIEQGGSPIRITTAPEPVTPRLDPARMGMQRYRMLAISRISRALMEEAMEKRALDRKEIDVDDIDFSNPRHRAFLDLDTEDLVVDPKTKRFEVLRELITSGARTRGKPESVTKRLVALRDKSDQSIVLVSVYNDAGKIMVTDPLKVGLKDRPSRELDQAFIKRYLPHSTVLLMDPVQNFVKHFKSVGEYEKEFATRIRRAEDLERIEQLSRFTGEAEAPEAAPIGLRPEDILPELTAGEVPPGYTKKGELPPTQVGKGEGGSMAGPHAEEGRALIGMKRGELALSEHDKLRSREVEALWDTIEEQVGPVRETALEPGDFAKLEWTPEGTKAIPGEVEPGKLRGGLSSPQELRDLLDDINRRRDILTREQVMGRLERKPSRKLSRYRRGIEVATARQWAGTIAMRKIMRRLAKANPETAKSKGGAELLYDKAVKEVYDALRQAEGDQEMFRNLLMERFSWPEPPDKGSPSVMSYNPVEPVYQRALTPTQVRGEVLPKGPGPEPTLPLPEPAPRMSPEEQAQAAIIAEARPRHEPWQPLEEAGVPRTISELLREHKPAGGPVERSKPAAFTMPKRKLQGPIQEPPALAHFKQAQAMGMEYLERVIAGVKGAASRRENIAQVYRMQDAMVNIAKQMGRWAGGAVRSHLKVGETRAERKEQQKRRTATMAIMAAGSWVPNPEGKGAGRWDVSADNLKTMSAQAANAMEKAREQMKSKDARDRWVGRRWLAAAERLKEASDYALDHITDFQMIRAAQQARKELGGVLLAERRKLINTREMWNYIPGRYEGDVWTGSKFNFGAMRILGRNYRAPKSFKNYWEAIEFGPYIPVTLDIATLVEHRVAQGYQRINEGLWLDYFKGVKDQETDKPIVADAAHYIQGVKSEFGEPIRIEKRKIAEMRRKAKARGEEFEVGQMHPGPEYRAVPLYDGRRYAYILRGYEDALSKATNSSQLRRTEALDVALRVNQRVKHELLLAYDIFHLSRMGQYHLGMMGKRWVRRKTFPFVKPKAGFYGGFSALEFRPSDMERAVNNGYITASQAEWATGTVRVTQGGQTMEYTRSQVLDEFMKEGLNIADNMDALFRVTHGIVPGSMPLNRFLFRKMIPGMMAEMAVHKFEELNRKYPEIEAQKLIRDIARDVNIFYGNLGRQGIFKNPALREIAQGLFLAPGWVESLIQKEVRFAGRTLEAALTAPKWAVAKLAGEGPVTGVGSRSGLPPMGVVGAGMRNGLVAMFLLAQAINLASRQKLTFQNPEHGHKLDAYIPIGPGFWFSPMSTFMEILHDFLRLSEVRPRNWDAIHQIGRNKLSWWGRALWVLTSGKNVRGERIGTTAGIAREAALAMAQGVVPITLSALARQVAHPILPGLFEGNPKGAIFRQAVASGGVKIEPVSTKVQEVERVARRFMDENDLKHQAYTYEITNEESYNKLRRALHNDDTATARQQLRGLRKYFTDSQILNAMRNWAHAPFTGDRKTENLFLDSLSNEGLDLYSDAIFEKMEALADFEDFMIEEMD